MLFGGETVIYCENHMKYMICMGRMRSFSMLKQVVHIVSTGL
jgi:hypothetical protein